MKRAMRRGLEFHSTSASSPCSRGAATSSACAILLTPPPVLRLSSQPELNAASPSLALLLVPCPLSFLLPRLPLPPTATPPAALTWNPRSGYDEAAARGSSVRGTLARERAAEPGRDGVRPGERDGVDVVVLAVVAVRGRRKKKINKQRKWWRKKRDESANESSRRLQPAGNPNPQFAVFYNF
jgi:hypothetical protein